MANSFSDLPQPLKQGMIMLRHEFPFHYELLRKWRMVEEPSTPSIWVRFSERKYELGYNLEWIAATTRSEITSMLVHLVNHVLLKHPLQSKDDFPLLEPFWIACDVTANEFISGRLPKCASRLKDYPSLRAGQTTVTRYCSLKKTLPGNKTDCPESMWDDHSVWFPEERGPGKMASIGESPGGLIPDSKITGTDSANSLGGEILRMDITDALQTLGGEEVAKLPKEQLELISKALSNFGFGNSKGGEVEKIGSGKGRKSWKRILRREIGSTRGRNYSFLLPPRRFPKLVGIVPAMVRRPIKPHVMAVIDTSSSMTPEMLKEINGELKRVARAFPVTVVECDVDIQKVYAYKKIKLVHGRGGTSFHAPFATEFLKEHKPDLILYFTDGEGPAPKKKPPVPVYWCLMEEGLPPANWGKPIYISMPD